MEGFLELQLIFLRILNLKVNQLRYPQPVNEQQSSVNNVRSPYNEYPQALRDYLMHFYSKSN
jgi:hypothetical protein